MRRFCLIKEYPGSPKLGYISKQMVNYDKKYSHYVSSNWITPSEHPEFWEEVVEKDYEILQVSASDYNRGMKTGTIGRYWPQLDTPKSEYLKKYWTIHSIKRLSDGEVFTVGDYIDSTISDLGRKTELTGFKFFDNKLKVGLRHLGYYPLSTIVLPKKPLFTTEDGVDIFEGEYVTVYGISKYMTLHEYRKENVYPGIFTSDMLYFMSKEKAEEYLLFNKPCLSLEEVAIFYKQALSNKNNNSTGLINLVKEKLTLNK